MNLVQLSGTLPDRISEATRPWEWVGNLRLGFDPAQIRWVEVVGSGAAVFDATLDRRLGLVTVTPYSMVDAEAFARDGRAPELSFRLLFALQDGTEALSAETYGVAVRGIDDTPPEALTFVSGGTVRANEAGAVIGRLRVTDPDTTTGFSFSFLPEDAWMFEVVSGDTLKLRAGIVVPREDAPQRFVIVEVSDGTNRSAHLLSFAVDPGIPGLPQGAKLLVTGTRELGFARPVEQAVRGEFTANQLLGINGYGDLLQAVRPSGDSVWFTKPERLELLNGRLDFRQGGEAAKVFAMFDMLLLREPTQAEMLSGSRALASGAPLSDVAMHIMSGAEWRGSFGRASNAEFVRQLYVEGSGWNASAWHAAVDWHAGRIVGGSASRAQVAADIVQWAVDHGSAVRSRVEHGFWVADPQAGTLSTLQAEVFGRPGFDLLPRGAALTGWGGVLHHATELFAQGPNFEARFGSLSNSQFVDAMFTEVLGIQPQWNVFIGWYNALQGGVSRADALFAFASSPEAKARMPAAAPGAPELPHLIRSHVGLMLDALFVTAHPGTWTTPEANLGLHGALRMTAMQLTGNPTFSARYAGMSDSEYVDSMFFDVLGRAPDWSTFSAWYFALARGEITRGDVFLGFSSHAEIQVPLQRPPQTDIL